jgi:two-component system, chemotaxis family, sensor kinase Cph1
MASLDFVAQIKSKIADLTDSDQAPSDLSLTNCDREPIHIPSAIQPHGVLLNLSTTTLTILQVSQNSAAYLGYSPTALLGQPLTLLLDPQQIKTIQSCLDGEFEAVNPLRFTLSVDGVSKSFEGVVHLNDGTIVLELEPLLTGETVNFFDFHRSVKAPIGRFQRTQTLVELSQQAVTEIRRITGFDRVMLYRFDEDGSGHVIAEEFREGMEPFLGLRYPATDIPKQAKALYQLNLLRLIPDFAYTPVPLVPERNPATGKSLDMSLSVLRSVSPMHAEYLANMGVCASMSISLLYDRQLWGLIACHHSSPKMLSYETRTVCEFLGQVISNELRSKSDAEDSDYKIKLKTVSARFVETLSHSTTLGRGLHQNPSDLIDLVGASGVVFYENARITSSGDVPPEDALPGLVNWVDRQIGDREIFSTNALGLNYPEFAPYKDSASGLLALRISRAQQIYLLWFRPEVVQTVRWGGEPNKPTTVIDGSLRLSPRQSFELWKETVRLQSLPWKTCEINAALELRSSIIGIVIQKADELSLLNTELERSNVELESFAYVASHDLKEPLRAIHNYSSFLIEDYSDRLGEDGIHKLDTLMRLTQRMEALINSLLHYSRLGRAALQLRPVDLNQVMEGVLEVVKISSPGVVDVEVPRPLPTVECDRTQIIELFTNLVSNAIKYNDKAKKRVGIGYVLPQETDRQVPQSLDPSQTIFFVKDDGIGIREKHVENIFKIFKRLHAANRYGGGTGAGLTIVKKIVERHGGAIALQSTFGEGSTFYFTLGQR